MTENKPLETTSNAKPWDSETLPQGDAKRAAIREMFDTIAPRYDMVNRIMTFRLDTRWRKRAVRDLRLPPGSVVLDLASGTGDLCIDLANANLRPISMDLSFGMLAADRSGSPRVQTDILRLPTSSHSVDGVTCGFALRNLTNLEEFFVELARVVRPGGRIALLDVGVPSNPLIRWGNSIYFGKMVPFIGGLLSDRAPTSTSREASRTFPPLVKWLRHSNVLGSPTLDTTNSPADSPNCSPEQETHCDRCYPQPRRHAPRFCGSR